MALPLFELLYGYPDVEPQFSLTIAIVDGDPQPTATRIVMSSESGFRTVFRGDFTVEGGEVTGGTVTGFVSFAGDTRMIRGSGFNIDGAAFFDALANADIFGPIDVYNLLYADGLRVEGSPKDDQFFGTEHADHLIGRRGHDQLFGWEGDDLIRGGRGNDLIAGEDGFDILFGGGGEDVFSFILDPLFPPVGFGRIRDFTPGKDIIGLEPYFEGVPPGVLGEQYFHRGSEATTAEQVIIYTPRTGRLYFDTDGSGSEEMVLFARVTPRTQLTADDFLVGGFVAG